MRGHLEMKIVFDWVGILQIPSLKEAALPKVTYLCPSFPSLARRPTDCHDALKLYSSLQMHSRTSSKTREMQ